MVEQTKERLHRGHLSQARQWLLRNSFFLLALVIVLLGLLAYYPILDFTFFWEDPFDIGQVEPHSYLELFLVPTNNLYYRPLHLSVVKVLKLGSEHFDPQPFFLFNLGARIVASLLLFGFARRLTNSNQVALGAALLFLLSPVPYDSTAKAMSAHQVLLLPFVAALWLYLEGRVNHNRPLIGLSLTLAFASLLIHESGILLPLFILTLECYLRWTRKDSRFALASLIYLFPAAAFVAVWLAIPKDGNLFAFDQLLDKSLYLSQSLSFPIAGLLGWLGGPSLDPVVQASLAMLITLLFLTLAYGRQYWVERLLFLSWWLLASGLLLMTLSLDYLWTGSRLLYLPTLAAALIWGGILLNRSSWHAYFNRLLILFILVLSVMTINSLNSLYRSGSGLMSEIIQAGQTHQRVLFINVPDRYEYREPLYPVGFWGMMLAPVSQRLADFVWLATGQETETRSLSAFPLAADMLDHSPYRVFTRGSDAYGTELLYESILWADQVQSVRYGRQGEVKMNPVGNISRPPESQLETDQLASFGEHAALIDSDVWLEDDTVQVRSTFLVGDPTAEHVTLFFHIVDASGQIVAQSDGDSLGGLIPLRAWRRGNIVTDRRKIPLNQTDDTISWYLRLGLYDRLDGARLPVYSNRGFEIQDNAVVVPVREEPSEKMSR
ncbi:MAG: hypothetical protein R3300_12885 [Candidatus Promineifilaceae bacterium]|nr:hypothetical protein [Candidatus Promineifilaceae bacterium]